MTQKTILWSYRAQIRERKDQKNNKNTLYINVPMEYHQEIREKLADGWTVDITLRPCYFKIIPR